MDEKTRAKAQQLAEDVLRFSRNTLLVHLRFLDRALSRFSSKPYEKSTLLTDGQYLLYNPAYVLKSFRYQRETVVRDFLHIVLHCVYSHMFMSPSVDRVLWDLACDIAVEAVISDLGLKATEATRQSMQANELRKLKQACPAPTAEKLYNHFKNIQFDHAEAAKLRALFYADNHEIWYMSEEEKHKRFGIGGPEDNTDASMRLKPLTKTALAEEWKNIAKHMRVDMETFGKNRGATAGSLMQNLKEVTREKYDYSAFLKKFATRGEVMRINIDEFDYIFYSYGLQLYERMPLIEPLEYKDVKRIKEFVIAIDTSGSVSGEMAQTFVQKTYNILKSTESFFSKINLHIIQCDSAIQEHIKITTQEEFDAYIRSMTLKGFGGTDFRPVFSAVEDLQQQREFTNLKGLIYFTDGCGVFPKQKPNYHTAFVCVDDECNDYDVPPWAIKLILKKDEI